MPDTRLGSAHDVTLTTPVKSQEHAIAHLSPSIVEGSKEPLGQVQVEGPRLAASPYLKLALPMDRAVRGDLPRRRLALRPAGCEHVRGWFRVPGAELTLHYQP